MELSVFLNSLLRCTTDLKSTKSGNSLYHPPSCLGFSKQSFGATMSEQEVKRSKVELIKEESVGLRGKILTELADTSTGEVSGETERLLKFHGTYHQDDRDLR